MAIIRVVTLLLVCLASLLLVVWIFRPGAKSKYDKYSKIPLLVDENERKNLDNKNERKEKN